MTIYGVLDSAVAKFEQFTKHFFQSVHAYLTIISRKRFLERVQGLSQRANAETALLLLCMQLCAEPTSSGVAACAGTMYVTVRTLFNAIYAKKAASVQLIQAGALLALFEHNADLDGPAMETLHCCSQMGLLIGLDALPKDSNSFEIEERRRLYWGLLSLQGYALQTGPRYHPTLMLASILALHDEIHENACLFPVPSLDDILPSIVDSDYDEGVDEMPAANTGFLVSSRLPSCASSFSRQGQAIRLLYLVQMLVRERFDLCPGLMVSRIEHLDRLIVSELSTLLAVCDGNAVQVSITE